MSIPQRPFRGRDQQEEGQHFPTYAALDGRIGSDNVSAQAIVPGIVAAVSGGGSETRASHIAWAFQSFSISSSGAGSATTTLTHSLGRVPVGIVPFLPSYTERSPLFVASVSNWNSSRVTIGYNATAAGTVSATVILI